MVDSWEARWNLGGFRFAVQRYVNHLPFCKFFGKKMIKKCIFVDFGHDIYDYLE